MQYLNDLILTLSGTSVVQILYNYATCHFPVSCVDGRFSHLADTLRGQIHYNAPYLLDAIENGNACVVDSLVGREEEVVGCRQVLGVTNIFGLVILSTSCLLVLKYSNVLEKKLRLIKTSIKTADTGTAATENPMFVGTNNTVNHPFQPITNQFRPLIPDRVILENPINV